MATSKYQYLGLLSLQYNSTPPLCLDRESIKMLRKNKCSDCSRPATGKLFLSEDDEKEESTKNSWSFFLVQCVAYYVNPLIYFLFSVIYFIVCKYRLFFIYFLDIIYTFFRYLHHRVTIQSFHSYCIRKALYECFLILDVQCCVIENCISQ